MTSTYVRHIPSPPLNRYIEYLYYLNGRMPPGLEKIPPTPALNLQINLGDTLQMYDRDHITASMSLTESWLGGLYGVHHSIDWTSQIRLYGVRFKPNGAYPFLGFPLAEVYNQIVLLDAVWGRWASEIREQLHAAPTIETALLLLERWMLDRLCETPRITSEQKVVEYAIAAMSQKYGTLSIRGLSDQISISQKHLGTLFKRLVGASPKELARLYRFEHVLRSTVHVHPVDWTQMAQQCGYHDLSHLNKDFVAFTGNNPTDYLALHRRVYSADTLLDPLALCTPPNG